MYRLSKSLSTEYNDIVKLNFNSCNNENWVHVLENIDNKILAIGKGKNLIIYPINYTEVNDENNNNLLASQVYKAHDAAIHDVKRYDNSSCSNDHADWMNPGWMSSKSRPLAFCINLDAASWLRRVMRA